MALFVVINHLNPLDKYIMEGSLGYNLYCFIIPFAVPFFYLSAGFFLGKKIENIDSFNNNDYAIIKKTLFKVIKIYIVFTLIYLPITIYGFVHSDVSILKSLLIFIRNFLLIGENYNSWILWYILSEIYGLLLIYILRNKVNKNRYFIIIGTIIFLFGLSINFFNNITFKSNLFVFIQKCLKFIIPNGRILNSLLYISLGIFISKHEKIKKKSLCIFLIILLLVINTFVNNIFITGICRVICSYIIFVIVININFKNKKIADYCKQASKDFYFWHLYIFSVIQLLFEGKIKNTYRIEYFCITIIILFIFTSIHFFYVSNKNKLKEVMK